MESARRQIWPSPSESPRSALQNGSARARVQDASGFEGEGFAAFERLAETLTNRTAGGNRPLADVTRDLLRPLIQEWLDENLPAIVEQVVREEIERVARRRR